ncbi:hypothetical protein [Saccharicrinis sp. FJH54]|uniref:hypothetical protein n=1 Tax=Saccharicrinis sp. FJH54 TaxID=3344665 RepID=UPI0035D4C256
MMILLHVSLYQNVSKRYRFFSFGETKIRKKGIRQTKGEGQKINLVEQHIRIYFLSAFYVWLYDESSAAQAGM